MAQTVVSIVIQQFVVPLQLGLNGAHVQSLVETVLVHVSAVSSGLTMKMMNAKLNLLLVTNSYATKSACARVVIKII